VERDIWPVSLEDGAAVLVNFAEGDGSHPGPLEPETKASDATKEVEYMHKVAP